MRALKFPPKKPRVYVETTIPSYLVARPCRDIVRMASQEITVEWWEKERQAYELFSSEFVEQEIVRGDASAAKARFAAMEGIPNLEVTPEVLILAGKLVRALQLPAKAETDAAHIAIATVSGMDYLLTWNCTHINNAHIIPRIRQFCLDHDYELPQICTPQELQRSLP